MIGDSEIMLSTEMLNFLDVSDNRKEKVEVFLDLNALLASFASISGQNDLSGGVNNVI